jgi:hypothetical protein
MATQFAREFWASVGPEYERLCRELDAENAREDQHAQLLHFLRTEQRKRETKERTARGRLMLALTDARTN